MTPAFTTTETNKRCRSIRSRDRTDLQLSYMPSQVFITSPYHSHMQMPSPTEYAIGVHDHDERLENWQ